MALLLLLLRKEFGISPREALEEWSDAQFRLYLRVLPRLSAPHAPSGGGEDRRAETGGGTTVTRFRLSDL